MKIFKYIGLFALISIVIYAILFVRVWFGYQAGSGLGSLVDIDSQKYQSRYLEKYADTFFSIYPQYKVPPIQANNITDGYEFLHLTSFYFDTKPREIYCIQWEGTGFISMRFAYNYETDRNVIENHRQKRYVDQNEKLRMEKRLITEVLNRIDSIIAKSKDRDSAIVNYGS
jgi:hypothetical protein